MNANSTSHSAGQFRLIFSRQQVADVLGVSMTTLWRLEKLPEFPKRVNRSKRLYGYYADEVYEYLNCQQAGGEA